MTTCSSNREINDLAIWLKPIVGKDAPEATWPQQGWGQGCPRMGNIGRGYRAAALALGPAGKCGSAVGETLLPWGAAQENMGAVNTAGPWPRLHPLRLIGWPEPTQQTPWCGTAAGSVTTPHCQVPDHPAHVPFGIHWHYPGYCNLKVAWPWSAVGFKHCTDGQRPTLVCWPGSCWQREEGSTLLLPWTYPQCWCIAGFCCLCFLPLEPHSFLRWCWFHPLLQPLMIMVL